MNDCGPVSALSRRTRELSKLDRLLRLPLPDPLREHVRLADIRDGRIVFLAPTPAWGARLRTCQNTILAAAKGCGVQAAAMIVRVRPLPRTPQVNAVEPRRLSQTAAQHLRSAAQSVPDFEIRSLFLDLAACADRDLPVD